MRTTFFGSVMLAIQHTYALSLAGYENADTMEIELAQSQTLDKLTDEFASKYLKPYDFCCRLYAEKNFKKQIGN